jgi:hypothetical protein
MWEIIADPKDYGIDVLEEGVGNNRIAFPEDDRNRWAEEIGVFSDKLNGLAERSRRLKGVLIGGEKIVATPASLKTLKVMMFKMNDTLNAVLKLADAIEEQVVRKQ